MAASTVLWVAPQSENDKALEVKSVSEDVVEEVFVLAGVNGGIEKHSSFQTPGDPGMFVQMLHREIRRLLMALQPGLRKAVKHLTLSVPGHITSDLKHDIWIPSLPAYAGYPLKTAIEQKTGMPTEVINNASAGALAEMWLTEAQQKTIKNFVFLVIGDVGTGSGLVFDGRLYRGHDRRFAGEIGHTVIDPSGPKCACGKKGCWQLYVRDLATWQRYHPRKPFTREAFTQFLQDAKHGDKRALDALRETTRYLALGISNVIQMLNPEAVIISGSIVEIWDILEPRLSKELSALNILTPVRPPQENMDALFLSGAIHLGLQKLFQAPQLNAVARNI